MHIRRLKIENEGFLAGLDLEFKPGLNVIIGARGTGKTSVIELIRYCLGSGGFTQDAVGRGAQQARSILEGAAVTVELDGSAGPIAVTRTSDGIVSTTSTYVPRCTVLAQSEVEVIGAQASGRLHVLDRYRGNTLELERRIDQEAAQLRSLTAQIQSLVVETTNLGEQIFETDAVMEQLSEARSVQQHLLERADASAEERRNLAQLELAGNRLAQRNSFIEDALSEIDALRGQLQGVLSSTWRMSEISRDSDDANIIAATERIRSALELVRRSVEQVQLGEESLRAAGEADAATRAQIDEASRWLRQNLDAAQAGIGAASRQVQSLEERVGQLTALSERLAGRQQQFRTVREQRDSRYAVLDSLRDQAFGERDVVATQINDTLGPQIRATVIRSGQLDAYEAAIISTLRGTGIHYNVLAPLIARSISPFELVTWAEDANIEALSSTLDVTRDRAISLVSALRSGGTSEIIACRVDDEVVLELLDGHDYKPTDRLSIGQRCTVILPVLLGQHGDPLLVDQPEDHLDNAFVADTLVAALNRRAIDDQFILTSHNANIPVLGNADRIMVMDSDGDRGFVATAGDLDQRDVIQAINRIMEGGPEAFSHRSNFYARER